MSFQNNPNLALNNANLNALASQYAATFGYSTTDLIVRAVNKQIYDGAPQEFPLLALLNMKPIEQCNSDEIFFAEAGWQRTAIQVAVNSAGVNYPAQQTITITSLDTVSENMNMVYPTGEIGNIVSVIPATTQIVVQPRTNASLPAVVQGDNLAFMATIEPDGADGFKQYFRMSTITKYNFVQLMPFAIKWGEVEYQKYLRSGQFDNFMSMQFSKFYEQARVGLENVLWQGIRGEFKTATGDPAKTMGGMDYFMNQAGSPSVSTPVATVDLALEQIVMDAFFEKQGHTKFLFGAPRYIQKLSKAYKDNKTRYAPNDMIANLNLDAVNFSTNKVVLVPYHRFEDNASFPTSWAKRMYLLDLNHLNIKQFMPPQMNTLLNRSNGSGQNKQEMFITYSQTCELFNPLAWGKILIQ